LIKQPSVTFYLGGRRRDSDAIVISEGNPLPESAELNPAMRALVKVFHSCAQKGWAVAILVPAKR
jgi:hypothetical protein